MIGAMPLSNEVLEDRPALMAQVQALLLEAMADPPLDASAATTPTTVIRAIVAARDARTAAYWAETCKGWGPRDYQYFYDARAAFGSRGPLFIVEPLGSDDRADLWREFGEAMEVEGDEVVYFVE